MLLLVCSCPVLLMTGQRSAFNSATRAMHQTILRSCDDKAKLEFIEVAGVANLLQEKVLYTLTPPGHTARVLRLYYSRQPSHSRSGSHTHFYLSPRATIL